METNGNVKGGALARTARKHGLLLKLIIIGVLLLILLWPLAMYRSLVREREERRKQAESEIIGAWGGRQTVGGPFLSIPYVARSRDADGKKVESVETAYFLPDDLAIEGRVEPQVRSRGIYDATLYTTRLAVRGSFRAPDFSGWRIAASDILWDQAVLTVELPDMRGLNERVALSWGGAKSEFKSGKGSAGLFDGEIIAAARGLRPGAGPVPFSFTLGLQGGGSIGFLPLGDETVVRLSSPWKSPSFGGSFLPTARTIGDKGFDAEWKVLSMARAYPQRFRAGEIDPGLIRASGFQVDLMTPVDAYLKVDRALKYGILFIILPFAALFLFEVFSARRIHPLQYLFIGFADCLFYLLLLSLAEHLGFTAAYAVACAATLALVTAYTCAITRSWRRGIFMLPVLGAAYGFLAVVLHSEDYALLIGAIGIFVILAAVMMLTRRVDWYRLGHMRTVQEKEAPNAQE